MEKLKYHHGLRIENIQNMLERIIMACNTKIRAERTIKIKPFRTIIRFTLNFATFEDQKPNRCIYKR